MDAGYELASQVFGPTYAEASAMHATIRSLETLRSLEDVIVLVDGDEVVGFLRILDRVLHSPAGPVQAGGITSVCVAPRLRGQGRGIELMEVALERSKRRGDACSVLFARRAVDGWYPRLGYVGVGAHVRLALLGVAERPQALVASAVPGPDVLDRLARQYEASYSQLYLSFVRSGDWWARLQDQLALKRLELVLVGGDRDPAGYLVRSGGVIIEAAAGEAGREAVRDAAFSCGTLSLPPEHWLMKLARVRDHELSIRYSWSGGHMLRVIDPRTFPSGDGAVMGSALDHAASRQLLLGLAGALDGVERWPGRPAWSLVDEL